MSPRFKTWKINTQNLPEFEAEFQKWLFIHIAGVLFADKAGELLILKSNYFGLDINKQIKSLSELSELWGYSYQIMSHDFVTARVVVYNIEEAEKTLVDTPKWVLQKMNYAHNIEPEKFLKEIGRRWNRKNEIPHEIGLVLGYPVKDVLGYMGLIPLPCTGRCGWMIHGDPTPSLSKSSGFKRAREKALTFLQT